LRFPISSEFPIAPGVVWPPLSLQALFCLGLLAVALGGCNPFDRTPDNVALVVGSTSINRDRLEADMAFISADMDVPEGERSRVREKILDQCIDHYLILEYGKVHNIRLSEDEMNQALKNIKKGYTPTAFKDALLRGYVDPEQWKQRIREQLITGKIIERVSRNIAPPGYREIQEYYEKNRDTFRSPRMITFRQIVTRTREKADRILKRLHAGEKMDMLARKYSIAPEAENGGEVGWIAEGELDPSMERALFALSPGEISPVIQTPYGYHIFEVLAVKPAGLKKLSEVSKEIRSRLLHQKHETFLANWLLELRNQFKIKVNQRVVKQLEIVQ